MTVVLAQSLIKGATNSCGCLHAERCSTAFTKHGHARGRAGASKTYQSWYAMKDRCTNARTINFARYGGRGITFDPRWASFDAFLEDMGVRPAGTQLDRINNDGNYEKKNCRWVTALENSNNMSTNRRLTIAGITYRSVRELARANGLKPVTVQSRLAKGWPIEELASPLKRSRFGPAAPGALPLRWGARAIASANVSIPSSPKETTK